ncbi:MAG TPA: serine/threonine-protein kinase [Kofleriaceae bacterium]|nr:serine/threonine-protein kinase [Kofleriaceae bacterium]
MAEGEEKTVEDRGGPAAMAERTLATTTAEESEPTSGFRRGTTIRRYVVLDEVGAGAMGVVYAAYDYGLDRKVALKLLRDPRPGAARKRLLREAQALAKLSHPHVIAVYDVGTHREQVFVAMEFVEGVTLREWLAAEPRGWREVVDVFRRAGEGLAAAHAAGIVHRDFKPDNVLIDGRGRVRVGDFGLALVDRDEEEAAGAAPAAEERSASPVDATLTATGVVLGTPAYMAPEQHSAARSIDARADQFAFCVALYEGLYGERPFAGDSAFALYEQIEAGTVREPRARDRAAGQRAPAWLRDIVVRGLAFNPAARHPSMEALLDELRRPRAVRRRRLIAAAVATAVAAGAAGGAAAAGLFASADRPCQDVAARLAGVWDDARKRELRDAFVGSGARDADPQWKAFERNLDRYAAAWVAMAGDACEATHVRGEQSEELLDLRSGCLDRRMDEVRGLTDLYLRADPELVARATEASANLGSLGVCANAAALGEELPPPDPQRGRVMREQLSRARAQHLAGRDKEALAAARALAAAARAGGDRAVEAGALVTVAAVERATRELKAAEETAYQAIAAAEAARSGETTVDAWLELIHILSESGGRYEEARRMARLARGALERIGGDRRLEAGLEDWYGVLHMEQGALDQARPHLERALELREKLGRAGPESELAASIQNLALLEQKLGNHERALSLHRRARAVAAEHYSPDHPGALSLASGEASCLYEMGRLDQALAMFEHGLDRARAVQGERSEAVADARDRIGLVLWRKQRHAEALESFEAALAVHVDGGEAPQAALVHVHIGDALADMRRFDQAIEHHNRAAAIYAATLGRESPALADALEGAARVHIKAARPAQAIDPLERAVAIRDEATVPPVTRARGKYLLARLLVDLRRSRPRALALAEASARGYEQAGDTAMLAEVRSWLGRLRRGN